MFSWKNIKNTYNEKVKNSTSSGEKALGILEVVGKSLVSGATVVVKEAPSILTEIASTSGTIAKKNAQNTLKNSESTLEDKQKARAYLDKHDSIQNRLDQNRQKIKNSKLNSFDQDKIEKREIENYSLKISDSRKLIKNLQEKISNLVLERDSFELRSTTEEESVLIQNKIDKINNLIDTYKNIIKQNQESIRKYEEIISSY
ncbi:magnesium transporter CorA family protein [Acinetobacter brisouii]